jgi:hypothetical protein
VRNEGCGIERSSQHKKSFLLELVDLGRAQRCVGPHPSYEKNGRDAESLKGRRVADAGMTGGM